MYLTSYIHVASNNLILKTKHGSGNDYVLLLKTLRLLNYVFCYYLHFCLGYTFTFWDAAMKWARNRWLVMKPWAKHGLTLTIDSFFMWIETLWMYSLLYGSIKFYHCKFSRSNNNALCSYSWFLCDSSRSFFQWFYRPLEINNEFRKLPNHFCVYFKRTFLMGKQFAILEYGHELAANYYRTTFYCWL